MIWMIAGGVLAFGLGIYIGLGAPGWPGLPGDRVLPSGMRRSSLNKVQFLDWFRPRKRH